MTSVQIKHKKSSLWIAALMGSFATTFFTYFVYIQNVVADKPLITYTSWMICLAGLYITLKALMLIYKNETLMTITDADLRFIDVDRKLYRYDWANVSSISVTKDSDRIETIKIETVDRDYAIEMRGWSKTGDQILTIINQVHQMPSRKSSRGLVED